MCDVRCVGFSYVQRAQNSSTVNFHLCINGASVRPSVHSPTRGLSLAVQYIHESKECLLKY